MKVLSLAVAGLLLVAIGGCTSTTLRIDTPPPAAGEKILGPAEGSATGIMLLQFIPIKQNTRFQRAYAAALAQHPGAKRLVDIEIRERWFWAYILNGYGFTVKGKAVK